MLLVWHLHVQKREIRRGDYKQNVSLYNKDESMSETLIATSSY